MDETISTLRIEIGASSDAARQSIDRVSQSLRNLRGNSRQTIRVNTDSVAKAEKRVNALAKTLSALKRIAFYRLIRSAIKSVTHALAEGAENAYWYSHNVGGGIGYIAEQMDALSSASYTMQNQLGAAWATLKAAVTPVLIEVIQFAQRGLEVFTQLFALLSGKTTYLKAVDYTKQAYQATKKGAKAAKEWRNQLMGFDVINRLEEPSSGSGTTGSDKSPDYESMFEEAEIDDFFSNIANKLKELKESINFEPLLESWGRLKERISEIAKDIGDDLGWLWDNVLVPFANWTIEEALPASIDLLANALDFLLVVAKKLSPVFTTLWEVVFKPIATWIGDHFVAAVKWLSDTFGTLVEKIKNAESLGDFIRSLDGKETLILSIAVAIGAVATALVTFNTISKLVSGTISIITQGLSLLLSPVGLVVVGLGLLVAVGIELYKHFDTVREAFDKVGEKFSEFKERYGELSYWEELGKAIIVALGVALYEVVKWVDENFVKPIIAKTKAAWDEIKENASEKWEGIKETIHNKWVNIKTDIVLVIADIKTAVKSKWAEMKNDASEKWDNIKKAISTKWTNIKTDVVLKIADVKSTIKSKWAEIKNDAVEKWEEVRTNISNKWKNIKSDAVTKAGEVLSAAKTKWTELKNETSEKWESVKSTIVEKWKSIKGDAENNAKTIKETISDKWDDLKKETSTAWELLKGEVSERWSSLTSNSESSSSSIYDTVSSKWEDLKDNAATTWGEFKTTIKDAWEDLTDNVSWGSILEKIQGAWKDIKDFWNNNIEQYFTWSYWQGKLDDIVNSITMPHIKMPHVQVDWYEPFDGGLLGWVNIPHFGVSWYAKGGIVDGATLIGAGEAGKEAIIPLERNTEWISKVAAEMSNQQSNRGNYSDDSTDEIVEALFTICDRIIRAIPNGSDGIDMDALAHSLNKIQRRHERAMG